MVITTATRATRPLFLEIISQIQQLLSEYLAAFFAKVPCFSSKDLNRAWISPRLYAKSARLRQAYP